MLRTQYEPCHEISSNVVCATSKASDQPAHTRSLIRAFASRLNILWLWINLSKYNIIKDYKKGASHTYDCSFSNYFGSKHYDICQIVGNHMSRLTCSSISQKCTCGSTYPNTIMDYKKGASHTHDCLFSNYFGSKHYDICAVLVP